MESPDSSAAESIIGQFGVGFYSAFIVSDYVEVYSKPTSGEAKRLENMPEDKEFEDDE